MAKQNESNLDRVIRLSVGIVSLVLGATIFAGTLRIVFLIVGILGIFTGITGFCLIYRLFGISTKK